MKRMLVGAAVALGVCVMGTPVPAPAQAVISDNVRTFAVLPDGVRYPEGITANPRNGDIYVSTFDFGPNANALLRYDLRGRLIAQRSFGGTPLLGLEFGPNDGKVYIANFGASKIQRVAADLSGTVVDVATIPAIGAPAPRTVGNPDGSSDVIQFGSNNFPAPNAMAFARNGDLYVSDSFQGAIFRIERAETCSAPCTAVLVSHDPLLATAGFPPFGANGLAFSLDGNSLFIANTGDDRVLKMDLSTRSVTVFAESIDGADGLAMDASGLLWVAANQADELVALNGKGRVVVKFGSFQGVRDGRPEGFLFPASLVFVGGELFVTNLALPLTAAEGDEPEEDVTRWTVSRVNMRPIR